MAKGKSQGEDCTYVFGIPIHETEECRRRRKAAKYNYKEEKQDTRQSGHTDRADIRNSQQAASDIANSNSDQPQPDIGTTITETIGTVLPAIFGAVAAGLSPTGALGAVGGLLGGGDTSGDTAAPPTTDLTPYALAAGAAVLLLLWSSK